MAQFKIFTEKRDYNRNDPFGEKSAYAIRENKEANDISYKKQTQYDNSLSQIQKYSEYEGEIRKFIYDVTGELYPSAVFDYIDEVDKKYYNPIYSRDVDKQYSNLTGYSAFKERGKYVTPIGEEYYDSNFFTGDLTDGKRAFQGTNHFWERVEYNQKRFDEWKKNNPNALQGLTGDILDYNYFREKDKQELIELQKEKQIAEVFNEGDIWGFIPPGTLGQLKGIIQDPAVWSTLPLSFMTGGNSLAVSAIVKMALWEGVIASGTELGIQANVVDYYERLDGNYSWDDAKKTIALAGVGGATATALFAGIFKGVRSTYVGLLRNSADPEVKKIGKEIENIIKNKPENEETLQEVVNYINKSINELSKDKQQKVFEQLADYIRPDTYKTMKKIQQGDSIVDETNPMGSDIASRKEHNDRIFKAGEKLLKREAIDIADVPENKIDFNKNFEKDKVIRSVELDPKKIDFDRNTFQFKKIDFDPKTGVSSKFAKITDWDQDASNVLTVFQKQDGTYVVVDGHQRLGLAKKIQAEDPKQKPFIRANVYREVDGYTPQRLLVNSIAQNVRNGSVSQKQAAKLLNQSDTFIQDIVGEDNLIAKNWKIGKDIKNLSPESFSTFLEYKIPGEVASIIGRLIKDSDLQLKLLRNSNIGEVVDEINKANKLYEDGFKQRAVKTLTEFASKRIGEGDSPRVSRVGAERNPIFEGYYENKTKKPKPTAEDKELEEFSDPLDGEKDFNRQYDSVVEGDTGKVFTDADKKMEIELGFTEDGQPITKTMDEMIKDIEEDKAIIDLLKNCRGIK